MTKIDAAPFNHLASDGGPDHTHATTVSVGDILDRRVPLGWYESVAIVASLCSTLAGRDATRAPAPRDIVLTPKGTLDLPGDGELVALPRLLHELLEVTTPPTPLRLLVLHAIDGHGSPAKFGEALAYYERPGREELIQAARQRCLDAPLIATDPSQTVSQKLELEAKKVPTAPAARKAPAPKPRRRAAAILVACAGTAAVLFAVGYSQHPVGSFDIGATFRSAAAHLAETGRGVAHAVATGLSLEPTQTDSHEAAVASSDEQPRPSKPVTRHTTSTTVTSSTAPEQGSEEVVAQATETDTDPDVTTEPTVTLADVLPAAVPDAPSPRERNVVGPVIPPKLVDPVRLPSWAQPIGAESLNVIELDIAETGTVKSVRLVSPTIRMTDMMILSAAKTWIFEPALEDGRPVPYRLTLNWVGPNR